MGDDNYKCTGCGREWRRGYGDGAARTELFVGGPEVDFCVGKNGPKRSCVDKARQRRCPGCGGELGETDPTRGYLPHPAVCGTCAADIFRGREEKRRRETDQGDRRWVRLRRQFLSDWPYGQSELRREAAEAIADLLATPERMGEEIAEMVPPMRDRVRDDTDGVDLFLAPVQVTALVRLVDRLNTLVSGVRADAQHDGEDLLGKIVDGRLSVAELTDIDARKAK